VPLTHKQSIIFFIFAVNILSFTFDLYRSFEKDNVKNYVKHRIFNTYL